MPINYFKTKEKGVKTVLKRVNLDKVDEKIKRFIMSLKLDNDQYILETGGKPLVGLVSPAQLEKMSRAKERLFETVDKIWKKNKEVSAKQVQRDVADAVKAVR